MTATCATTITVTGTVTSVWRDITQSGAYMAVYVGGRPVRVRQTGDMPLLSRGQYVEITGHPVIGDPDVNMTGVTVRPAGAGCGAVA